MPPDHYFTASPGSAWNPRPLTVTLAGRRMRLATGGGIFSPDHVDTGTAVLLSRVPPAPQSGDLLDLGCGWGPVALSLALASPAATVWAVDVNERALELVRRNAETLGLTGVHAVTPDEVPERLRFATIWSNPPIRVGKTELHRMLLRWLPRLAEHSTAWLVVQRNLGSDSLQRWLQEELPTGLDTTRATSVKGYRVLRVHRD